MALTEAELAELHRLLESARDLDPSSPTYLGLERAVSHLAKTARAKRRGARRVASRAEDRATLRGEAGARATLHHERPCYVCKRPYRVVPPGYPLLCAACATRSALLRDRPIDVRGRRALVTGGRVKIGYATALSLLRGGAEVHVTSRFPAATRATYQSQPDAAEWSGRLSVHGLDFRDLGSLRTQLAAWREGPPFDIVINNAAQSVWQPPPYFEELYAGERAAKELGDRGSTTDAQRGWLLSLASLASPASSGLRELDATREDTWDRVLGDIPPVAMIEAQVVNAIAPYLICSELRPNLRRSPFADRFIVNVTAAEGQFARPEKSVRHPHNNMAKAGLNMLTRTSAADLATDGIYLTSVDPGWMSKEGQRTHREGQKPAMLPLTVEDSAARVLHPIAEGLLGNHVFGVLLKDFQVVPW